MYLKINMVKYDTNWEIMNIYENLWIVWSQFCTDRWLSAYIQSSLNIYWFISIRIHWQWIQTNSYSVTFSKSQYLVQHLMNETEGKKTTIRCYLVWNEVGPGNENWSLYSTLCSTNHNINSKFANKIKPPETKDSA